MLRMSICRPTYSCCSHNSMVFTIFNSINAPSSPQIRRNIITLSDNPHQQGDCTEQNSIRNDEYLYTTHIL